MDRPCLGDLISDSTFSENTGSHVLSEQGRLFINVTPVSTPHFLGGVPRRGKRDVAVCPPPEVSRSRVYRHRFKLVTHRDCRDGRSHRLVSQNSVHPAESVSILIYPSVVTTPGLDTGHSLGPRGDRSMGFLHVHLHGWSPTLCSPHFNNSDTDRTLSESFVTGNKTFFCSSSFIGVTTT